MTAPVVRTQIQESVDTWTDLVKVIDASDGIALISMETLRKLEGAQRLGVHVLKSIASRLGTLGLGHLPEDLPNRQDQDAIVYRYGTPASEVVSAIKTGLRSPQDVRNTYRALHKLNTVPDTTEIVHKEDLEEKLTTVTNTLMDLMGASGRASAMNDMLGDLK